MRFTVYVYKAALSGSTTDFDLLRFSLVGEEENEEMAKFLAYSNSSEPLRWEYDNKWNAHFGCSVEARKLGFRAAAVRFVVSYRPLRQVNGAFVLRDDMRID